MESIHFRHWKSFNQIPPQIRRRLASLGVGSPEDFCDWYNNRTDGDQVLLKMPGIGKMVLAAIIEVCGSPPGYQFPVTVTRQKLKRYHLFVSKEQFPNGAQFVESFVTDSEAKNKGKGSTGEWFQIFESQGDGALRHFHSSHC